MTQRLIWTGVDFRRARFSLPERLNMSSEAEADPFDTLLTLEDQYYSEGYEQGVTDGSTAGRIEGRIFGLEKGFEKFVAMGKLHGKAAVWDARAKEKQACGRNVPISILRAIPSLDQAGEEVKDSDEDRTSQGLFSVRCPSNSVPNISQDAVLSSLPNSHRLAKHIDTLFALTEPETFSAQNDEASVADFDDRLKRAEAKARLISISLREDEDPRRQSSTRSSGTETPSQRRVTLKRDGTSGDSNIEDFGNPIATTMPS